MKNLIFFLLCAAGFSVTSVVVAQTADPVPIIFDTDFVMPPADDSLALMLALQSPEIEILGITTVAGNDNWERALEVWAEEVLIEPSADPLLEIAMPRFERIMIRAALKRTGGRKRDAAKLLGWGRNTLTRRIAELEMTEAR